MNSFIARELRDGILTITLRRVAKRNALTSAMYDDLSRALEEAETAPEVRVILLQADGENFTAGNDIPDFIEHSTASGSSEPAAFRFVRNLGAASKPIVAAAQGNAVGVGATLLLHCDLVYLADNARLVAPFVNLALVPEAASSWLMPLRIGHVRAYAMFALGEPIDASTALQAGLANAVVPAAEVRSRAASAASALARQSVGALAATKLLMRERSAIAAHIEVERTFFLERLKSPEALAALEAFTARASSASGSPKSGEGPAI